jgi:tRNA 2-selenouridine synthase
MWTSDCVVLDAPIPVRVELLKSEYAHYLAEPEALASQLECLTALHGVQTIAHWQRLAREGREELVEELLVKHYDPAYSRSTLKHYPALERAPHYTLADPGEAAFKRLAAALLEDATAQAR